MPVIFIYPGSFSKPVCTVSEDYMRNESYSKEMALLQEALVRYIEIDFKEK